MPDRRERSDDDGAGDAPLGGEPASSITWEIDPALRLVIVTYIGKITLETVAAARAEVRRDPGFDPNFALLFDYTQADASAIDTAAVKRIAANTPFVLVRRVPSGSPMRSATA